MTPAGVWNLTAHLWPGVALCIFVFYHLAMQLSYSRPKLKSLDCRARLDCVSYNLCRTLGTIRRPLYVHRSKTGPSLIYGSDAQIPTLW